MNLSRLLLNRYALLAALLLAAGALYWVQGRAPDTEARYRTQLADRGDIAQQTAANGTLNPVVLVNVGTQVSGTVKKWYADFNDHVTAGQKLLELDPPIYQAQVNQSLASLANVRSQLKLATANAARADELFKQEYISRQELDVSVQALEAARAQVALVQAQLAKDRTNLDYSVIRSPVTGVVVSREVDVGQTVAASLQTPTLFKIAQDLSKMQIDSSYAEADVGNIRVGQPATFRVDAFPNRIFHGAVRQVRLNPTTQQNIVTYDVVIGVDNPEQILMPGMTAYVNTLVAERKNVLRVPNAALRFHPAEASARKAPGREDKPREGSAEGKSRADGPGGTVYVLDNGRPRPLRVSTGITDNRMTEIIAGDLQEGDALIVEDRQPPAKPAAPGTRLF
ncbi:MAG: efflux RND transporter periplasmic adaptor subunit [Betaproteobacteria bacterium HGW-Betaproteobacteria-11]|nr:MAG: efflux RND transporter periplasmic adaptor subunit [Betaproteobacteria bacterium HGW-Betaproteobacteria-11]